MNFHKMSSVRVIYELTAGIFAMSGAWGLTKKPPTAPRFTWRGAALLDPKTPPHLGD